MSGQLRSFAQCYPTQRWQVYRHYPDCHFFIVVQNNDQVNSIQALRRDYGEDHVHAQFITDPTGLPQIAEEYGRHAPYANAAPHNRLMMQHHYQLLVWQYFQEVRGDKQFDTIIRMRPDNWMQGFTKQDAYAGIWDGWEGLMYEETAKARRAEENAVYSPHWGKFGGMNDRLAIMTNKAAPIYFSLYNHIEALLKDGCPFHPESLLLAHLEKNNVKVRHTLNAMFGTLRLPRPDPKNPNQMIQEMRFPEILPHESAEYARSR